MRRLWISVAILVLLFSATLVNSRYLKSVTDGLTNQLNQAEAAAETGDWAKAAELTKAAQDDWHSHDLYLYTMLRHSDTDQIHTGFREVLEFIYCQEGGEYSAANARLLSELGLLYEMEQFNLKNLL